MATIESTNKRNILEICFRLIRAAKRAREMVPDDLIEIVVS